MISQSEVARSRLRHWHFQVASVTIASLYCAFKASIVSGLGYTADMFNFVVMSKSLWLGRPWYFENGRGFGAYLHNNFIVPLLGMVTFPFGVYGIVLLLAGGLGAASLAIESVAHSMPDARAKWIRGLNFAVFLGPVTFWIMDNPVYGFHPELFYVPLTALHAVASIKRSRYVLLSALAICIVRQDGPIVVCTIDLLYLALCETGSHGTVGKVWVHALKVLCAWAFVFVVGLWMLQHFGSPGQVRINQALNHFPELLTASPTRSVALTMLCHSLLFVSSGLLIAASFSPSRTALAMPFFLPTLGISLIASFAYLPDIQTTVTHGMTWNPRAAIVWSVVVPMALFIICCRPTLSAVRGKAIVVVGICAVSVVAQASLLWSIRSYNVLERVRDVAIGDLPGARLSVEEGKFLDCLARRLPSSTAVAIHGSLAGKFHRFDIMFANGIEHAWTFPEIIVCETIGRLPFEYGCNSTLESIVASHGFASQSVEGIRVAFTNGLDPIVRRCQRGRLR